LFFSILILHILRSTLFPYTTLFRSLSLQAITQSKIRLTANDFVSYKKTFNNLSQKTVFLSIFINKSTSYNSLNFSEKNTTILSRSEEHTSELQSPYDLVCRLLLEKK